MTAGDVLIVVALIVAAIVGARAGVVRGAGVSVGVVLLLVAGLWLRFPIASQILRFGSGWTPARAELVAILAILVVGWVTMVIYAAGLGDHATLRVLPRPIEPVAGAVLGVVAALLMVSCLEVALAIGTNGGEVAHRNGDLVADAYRALRATAIGTALHRTVISDLGGVLAPLLPIGTRTAIGLQ